MAVAGLGRPTALPFLKTSFETRDFRIISVLCSSDQHQLMNGSGAERLASEGRQRGLTF